MGVLKNLFKGVDTVTINGQVAYGTYNSFPIAVEKASGSNSLLIRIFINIDHKRKEKLYEKLLKTEEHLKKKVKNFNGLKCDGKTVTIDMGNIVSFKADNKARDVLKEVIEVLDKNECSPGCECCGEKVETKFYLIDSTVHCLCSACRKETKNKLDKKELEEAGIKPNYLKGILFGFLGTLIAGIILIILLRFNIVYVSILLPLIPYFCFAFGSRRVGKIGAIFTTVICLIAFFFATRIGMAWKISTIKQSGIFETFKILNSFSSQNDTKSIYFLYMLAGYGLSAVGSVLITVMTFLFKGKSKITEL